MRRSVPRRLPLLRLTTRTPRHQAHTLPSAHPITTTIPTHSSLRRSFHTTPRTPKGLSPHSEDPEPPQTTDHTPDHHVAEPAHITADEYHDLADQYIDVLVLKLEEMAEEAANKLEIEYSAGVLTLSTKSGDYVLNKQPPNKQIWISSPISGPKRYDWVISGDHHHEKEGTATGAGEWIYLRDGSRLDELLKREVGVDLAPEVQEGTGREGLGGAGVSE